MEFFGIAIAGAVILVVLAVLWQISRLRTTPPGPFCWPIIGCIFSLKQPLHLCFLKLSRKYGPVIHLKVGMLSLVVVNSPEMAKEVLKTRDVEFANRPPTKNFETYSCGFKGIVFAPCGEEFKTIRRLLLAHLFSTAKLNSTIPILESELGCFVSSVNKSNAVELRDALGELSSNIIFRFLFGIKSASSTKAMEVLEGMLKCALNINIGELFPALDWLDFHGVYKKMSTKLLPQMHCILGDIIQERRNQRGASNEQDLLDILLNLHDDGSISHESVLSLLVDMIAAGIETTQGTMEWTMAEVMNNPRVMKKAREEIDNLVGPRRLVKESDISKLPYVQAIVKESLRLHPPAPLGIPHYNPKESTLASYKIPAKSQILVNIWAIGRDPAYWRTEPEIFMPERFLDSNINVTGQHFELLPFSSGRRICAGYPLAVRFVPLAIATFLHAFDWERLGTNSLEEATGTLT